MASEEPRIVQHIWLTLQTHISTNSTVAADWGDKNENRLCLNSLLCKKKISVSLLFVSQLPLLERLMQTFCASHSFIITSSTIK